MDKSCMVFDEYELFGLIVKFGLIVNSSNN